MAFKRVLSVLSVLMVVVVLISTLCAFKPIETNFEPLMAEYPMGTVSIWAEGVLPDSNCYIRTYGANGIIQDVVGYISMDEKDFSINTGINVPVAGSASGTWFYEIRVRAYSPVRIKYYKQDELDPYYIDGVNGSIQSINLDEGALDFTIDIYQYVTSGTLNTYYFYLYIDSKADVISDYDRGFNAGYIKGLYDGQQNGYDKGYDDGYREAIQSSDAYHEGRADGIAGGLFGLFTNPIGELFKFVIVPAGENPAVTLGAVFLVLVAISLIIIYLKYFAGG